MEGNAGIQPQNGGQMNGPLADSQAGGMAMAGSQGRQDPAAQGQPRPGGPMMGGEDALNPPGQGGGAEASCSCSEHETNAPAGSGQVPGNPGPSGPAGMNPGQPASQGAWHPGNPPYSPGAMGTPGPSAGPFSQPGQAPWSFPGPAQMGTQPGAFPGQGPHPMFSPPYGAPHNQPPYPPWAHPASGPQGPGGPPTGSHMGHPGPGQGVGYMGADAQHFYHDENRFGQMADMVGRFLNGEATTADMVNGLFSLNFRDDQFWKGALLGAVAVLVFNSGAVQQGVGKLFGKGSAEAKTSSESAEKPTQKKSK
jgi:hypothetical protein